MNSRRRIAVLLLGSGILVPSAQAQAPRPSQPREPARRRASAYEARFVPTAEETRAPSRRSLDNSSSTRSVLTRRPTARRFGRASRYPDYYERMWEDYRAGPPYQNADPQMPVARFDTGGGPNRNQQLQAEQIGIQRANAVQQQLSEFSRPYGFGYGFGFGFR